MTINQEKVIPQLWEKRRRYRRPPYGYYRDPENPDFVIPDPNIIKFLEEAIVSLNNGLSLREVADWLEQQTRIPISHAGLRHIWYELFPEKAISNKPKAKPRNLSPEEKAERKRVQLIAQQKKKMTYAKKKIAKLNGEIEKLRSDDDSQEIMFGVKEFSEIEIENLPEEQQKQIIFQPNPGPQTEFLEAPEFEVLYGGAAGGGKSYALIADPMRFFEHPSFKGVIFRRTNDELRDLIREAQILYRRCFGDRVKWHQQKSTFTLPAGGTLWFTYLEREDDVERHRGQTYTYAAFDELTQYPTPYAWNFIRSRIRSADKTIDLYMRATTNPGGPGHGWVKRMFIDPAPHGKPFWATDIDTGKVMKYPTKHPKAGQPLFQRRFIPARLIDNPYLFEDGVYEMNLLSLPEQQQRQLLEGDWDVADGAAFSEFRRSIHVCEPFPLPSNWRRFRSCDFGYSTRQASAVHWYAVDPTYGTLYVYRELYVNQLTGKELARKILSIEFGEDIAYGVLDSSVWAIRGQTGPSIAEEMIAEGCRMRPSDRSQGSRVAGKNRLHELLRIDPVSGKPGIMFFDTCRQIISDLPVIPADKESDDIDPDFVSDHAYDSIRYGIMSRPRPNPIDWDTSGVPRKPINLYSPSDSFFGY